MTNNCKGCRKTISGTRIMNSCAAYGAAAAYMKIRDCAVLLHGPDSCRYVMGVFRGKAMDAAYSKNLYDGNQTQNLFTTSMENGDSIFGGISKLEEKANELLKTYNTLAIVTTCMPGIIGDDCRGLVKKLKETHPDSNIILIPTDGDVKGDFNDGFYMAIDSMMDLVAPCKEKRNTVNLIGSSFYNIRSKSGFTETRRMLSLFGLNIGCMFLEETDMESVIKFNESMVDIKLSDLFGTKEIANIVSNRTGRTIFPYCLPIGLYDYQEWLYAMGELTNKKEIALKEIEASKEKYNMFLKRKSILEGKRIAIYSRMGTNLDWLLDVLKDIGSDILFLGYQNDIPMSRYSDIATANISPESVADIVKPFNPHLILGDYPFPIEKVKYTGVWKIEPGLDSVFRYVEYLEDVLKLPDYGGWNND